MALICIERAFGRLDGFISLVLGTSTEASSGDSLAGLRRPSQSAAIVHRSDLKGMSQHPDCASSQWHGSRGPRPLLQLDEEVHMFELTLLYHSGLHYRFNPTHTLRSFLRVNSYQGFGEARFCSCGRSWKGKSTRFPPATKAGPCAKREMRRVSRGNTRVGRSARRVLGPEPLSSPRLFTTVIRRHAYDHRMPVLSV